MKLIDRIRYGNTYSELDIQIFEQIRNNKNLTRTQTNYELQFAKEYVVSLSDSRKKLFSLGYEKDVFEFAEQMHSVRSVPFDDNLLTLISFEDVSDCYDFDMKYVDFKRKEKIGSVAIVEPTEKELMFIKEHVSAFLEDDKVRLDVYNHGYSHEECLLMRNLTKHEFDENYDYTHLLSLIKNYDLSFLDSFNKENLNSFEQVESLIVSHSINPKWIEDVYYLQFEKQLSESTVPSIFEKTKTVISSLIELVDQELESDDVSIIENILTELDLDGDIRYSLASSMLSNDKPYEHFHTEDTMGIFDLGTGYKKLPYLEAINFKSEISWEQLNSPYEITSNIKILNTPEYINYKQELDKAFIKHMVKFVVDSKSQIYERVTIRLDEYYGAEQSVVAKQNVNATENTTFIQSM